MKNRVTLVEYHSIAWAMLVELGWTTMFVDGNLAYMQYGAAKFMEEVR